MNREQRPGRTAVALLAGIVVIAGVARFWGLSFGLPHTQARPDETFVIDVALSFLGGEFSPPFYDYPWLDMWLVTGLYLAYYTWGLVTGTFHSLADLVASWPRHWEPFFLLSRGLSATAGTLTVVVVFWIGSRLWNVVTGLVAAFFLSLAFLHARDSHFGTTDVLMMCLVMLAVGFLLNAYRGDQRSYWMAGLFGGLAAATKYSALLLVAPMLLTLALHIGESDGRRARVAIYSGLIRLAMPFAVGFAIGVPFVLIDTERFLRAMREMQGALQVGPLSEGGAGWRFHLEFSLRHGMGVPLLAAGLTGALAMLVREWKIATILFFFPLAYYAVAASTTLKFVRYALPVVPFLCLAAAWLVCHLAYGAASMLVAGGRFRGAYTLANGVAIPALSLALIAPSAISVWELNRVISQTDNRVVVVQWFDEHVPTGSSVLQSGSAYGHAQFWPPHRQYNEWKWDRGYRGVHLENGQVPSGRPDWILLQESPLPSDTQDLVKTFLKDDYLLVHRFRAFSPDRPHAYDLEDAFFVPYAGFRGVERPGPNFSLYQYQPGRATTR